MRITEIKRHLDGTEDRFECELLVRRPHVMVVQFDVWRARSAGGFRIPRGSTTLGFFWTRRAYSLYRFFRPGGAVIADRFDVVEDVRIGQHEVSYLDLLVDVWFGPDGTVGIEDEDEVQDHRRRGLITLHQLDRVDQARDLLVRRHRTIVREALRLIE